MSQALYRKWRPQTWDAVIGQQHVVETLRNALAAGRVAHAYLFAGPRGTGKTTTARLLAKAVNCLDEQLARRPCGACNHCQAVNQGRFLDLIEIDAASNTSVEDVRNLRDKINFSPNQGRYKVYIIDEVHMLSTAAFNALLKTLEEPPPHALFILATTEVHKIPATVLSRCQRHEFRRIPVVEIVSLLKQMCKDEGIQAESEALTLIARQSTGALRDAISLLDQLASTGQKISLEFAQNVLGTAASQSVLDVVQALVDGRPDAGLDYILRALDAGSDPRQFARQIVDYLRDLLLMKIGNADQVEATAEIRLQMGKHEQAFSREQLLHTIRSFNHAAGEARSIWQPSLPLEIAFLESLADPSIPPETPWEAEAASMPPQSQTALQRRATPAASQSRETAALPPPDASSQDQAFIQDLAQVWQKILTLVRKTSPKASGALNSSKAHYLNGNILMLSFASDIVKSQMEKPENLEVVQKVLQQVFEREITIRCFVDTAKRDSIPPGVDNNGMVAAAVRDLGGEIVDIQ